MESSDQTIEQQHLSRLEAVYGSLSREHANKPANEKTWRPSFGQAATRPSPIFPPPEAQEEISDDEEYEQQRRELVPGLAMDLKEEDAAYGEHRMKPSLPYCRQVDAEAEEDLYDKVAGAVQEKRPPRHTAVVEIVDEDHNNNNSQRMQNGARVPDHVKNPQRYQRYEFGSPLTVGGGIAQLDREEAKLNSPEGPDVLDDDEERWKAEVGNIKFQQQNRQQVAPHATAQTNEREPRPPTDWQPPVIEELEEGDQADMSVDKQTNQQQTKSTRRKSLRVRRDVSDS